VRLRFILGCLLGVVAGIGLSAHQYWGPLDYLGLRPALGLFAVNLVVGAAGGVLGGFIWGRRGIGRALLGVGVCAAVVVWWGHWNLRRDINVVMLVSDAVRADHVSAYGYHRETTPNWDALARGEGGMLFETAIAQGTATMVGGPALMTGLYQCQTGYTDYDYVLPESVETLAEGVSRLGHTTYGIVSNPHLCGEKQFSQGFSTYEDALGWTESPSAALIAWDFARWYERQAPDRLFAFLFFIDTHAVYKGLPKDVHRFRPEYVDREWRPDERASEEGAER